MASPVFATPPTNGTTTLAADTMSSAGGSAGSGTTTMLVSQLGSWAGGISSNGIKTLRAGYVEVACQVAVCPTEPKEGTISMLGTVIEAASQPIVSIANASMPEKPPVDANVTVDVSDPTLWHFDSDQVPVLEGTNVLTATATDAAGNTDNYTVTITYDATPPPRPTLDPVANLRQDPLVDLRGQKAADTEIWINGMKEVLLDTQTTWERLAYPLAEGFNRLAITAKDEAKNESAPLTVDIFVDASPPAFSLDLAAEDAFYDPGDHTYYTNLISLPVTVTVTTDDADLVEVLVNGANPVAATPAPGSQAQDGQTPDTYTATLMLTGEGSYSLQARVTTVTGWLTTGSAATIVVDQTAPAAPVVTNANPPPTPSNSFLFTGTKEAGAGLFRDSTEVFPVGDDATAWSDDVTLVEGPNNFAYTQEDRASNSSGATPVSIIYDPTAPTTPVVTDDGASTPDYTSLHAIATSSDEWTNIVDWTWTAYYLDEFGQRVAIVPKTYGLGSEVTLTNLALAHGTTYYLEATAINEAGLESAPGVSDGIVPSQPPEILDVEPEDGDAYAIGDTIRLKVVDVTDPDGDTGFEYQFWVMRGTTEVFRQDWSASDEALWDTADQVAGFYDLLVEVRDVYGASMVYGDNESWSIRLLRLLIPMPPDE